MNDFWLNIFERIDGFPKKSLKAMELSYTFIHMYVSNEQKSPAYHISEIISARINNTEAANNTKAWIVGQRKGNIYI